MNEYYATVQFSSNIMEVVANEFNFESKFVQIEYAHEGDTSVMLSAYNKVVKKHRRFCAESKFYAKFF